MTNTTTFKKPILLWGALQAAIARSTDSQSRLEEIELHDRYVEPGYQDPPSGLIATGNWNQADRRVQDAEGKWSYEKSDCDLVGRVATILEERYGVELEWSDEWSACQQCGGLVRTQASGWGWQRSYAILDGEFLCCDCLKKDAATYLESLEGNDKKCVTIQDIDLAQYGYVRVLERLKHGMHEGMASNPKVISGSLREVGASRFLFVLDHTSQFYIEFSLWIHQDEVELVEDIHIETDQHPSPATLMKQALQSIKALPAEPGKIAVTKVNVETGTSMTKLIPNQDFVDGKALKKRTLDRG